jgi:transcription initiation factor TFIID TATA-box-binding protein
MVCTGAKSAAESRKVIMKVVKELKKGGVIILGKPSFKVVNIVASASLGGKVDLEQVVVRTRQTMYEPEQFPRLIYRMDEPKVVILVFASGNLVITGAKEEQGVYDAVHKLHESLEEQNLIF